MIDIHREAYREEAQEHLIELEDALLELEGSPDNMDLIGKIFRAMHTIKGSGAMFGFDDIANFTHEVETVFDLVRIGKIPVTKRLIDLTLQGRDCIRMMLQGDENDQAFVEHIHSAFKEFAAEQNVQVTADTNDKDKQIVVSEEPLTYLIQFRPHQDIFLNGTNPILLFNELRELGSFNAIAQLGSMPSLESFNPELCHTCWDIILTTNKGIDAIRDVFIFVEDVTDIKIEIVDEGDCDENYKKLGEILVDRGDLSLEDLKVNLKRQKRIGEILVDEGLVSPDKVQSALAEQEQVREIREKNRARENGMSSIRVAADKLDKLVNLVGELVTVQARLTREVAIENNPKLVSIAEGVEGLTEELRDTTMSIRMLPIGTTFSKFKRLVRDLSGELGREVNLYTEGAETELDKTVIEKLNDPLVHIIRNSIDHGIEPPSVREALGKPRQGRLLLSAKHSGTNVLIEISDDGAGLDKEKIKIKAIEKKLILPDAEVSENKISSLIFAPGFSTAENVTNVSGRGVGMDVVKRAIDALRGSIDVKSENGMGTIITLKLPLTLAIIDGLLVKIGVSSFVLPLSLVEECVELSRGDVDNSHGRHIANVRGQFVPYVRLREEFGIDGRTPDTEQIVITEIERNRVGFVVDSVIGQHQTVIKTLGRIYRDTRGISGATILGDGTVALIMDVQRLQQMAECRAIL